jgi:putative restriction endonuclease
VGTSGVERLLSLQQYRQGGDGDRAPHKPLLVLLALHRLAETGSSDLAWSETSDQLADLIAEFGPASKTGRAQSAAYPFTRLRRDGVWHLSADVPFDAVTPLRDGDVHGRLDSAIERELLAHPDLLASTVRGIVDAQFPSTLAPDVLIAVGFDPEALGAPGTQPAEVVRRRSAQWRRAVIEAWDGACAFCGFDGSLAGAPVGIEAAHVRWFNFGGPDELDNGLALCALHHKLFDRGALGLSDKHRVVVSSAFRAVGSGRSVYDLHGHELRARPGAQLPAPDHVRWHATQVFKGEPLGA